MSDGVNESAASAEAHIVNGGREAPQSFVALALGSVGVVYGDIGYQPALRLSRGGDCGEP